ncbi:hypothetical protein VPH35_001733 [Triticum aestivum]
MLTLHNLLQRLNPKLQRSSTQSKATTVISLLSSDIKCLQLAASSLLHIIPSRTFHTTHSEQLPPLYMVLIAMSSSTHPMSSSSSPLVSLEEQPPLPLMICPFCNNGMV